MQGSDWPGLGHVPTVAVGERAGPCKSQVLREFGGRSLAREKWRAVSRRREWILARPRPGCPLTDLGDGGSHRSQAAFYLCDEKSGDSLSWAESTCDGFLPLALAFLSLFLKIK